MNWFIANVFRLAILNWALVSAVVVEITIEITEFKMCRPNQFVDSFNSGKTWLADWVFHERTAALQGNHSFYLQMVMLSCQIDLLCWNRRFVSILKFVHLASWNARLGVQTKTPKISDPFPPVAAYDQPILSDLAHWFFKFGRRVLWVAQKLLNLGRNFWAEWQAGNSIRSIVTFG